MAIAADVMLLIGLVGLLWAVRRVIPFSIVRLLAVPSLGAVLGGLVAAGVSTALPLVLSSVEGPGVNLWATLLVKGAVAMAVYGLVLAVFEWRDYRTLMRSLPQIIHPRKP